MEESNFKPMTERPLESKGESDSKPISFQLFEKAVDDAQYMVSYAAGKCDERIDGETILTLLRAKRLVEEGKPVDAELEAEFWLAYQRVWELVKPATAESIKASLPIEKTLASKPTEKTRSLFPFKEKKATSKASAAVDRYTRLTLLVLFLLLAFQIYWVIGNQLTTQLAGLLDKGTSFSSQISENQKEYSTIEILYRLNESENFQKSGTYTFYASPEWERDTLDNVSTRARLESDFASLKAEMERSYALLSIWSKPWDWIIQEENPATNDKYAGQLASLTTQIATINEQISHDKDGTQTSDALNSTLSPQLKIIEDQLGDLYARNDEINLKEAELQGKIQEINDQLTDLTGDDSARKNSENALRSQLDSLVAQLTDLEAIRVVIQGQKDEINSQLNTLIGAAEADASRISALESQLNESDAQLTNLQANLAALQGQRDEINSQLLAIQGDDAARENRKSDLESQLNELNAQVTDLEANRAVIGDQIQSLQSQHNDLISQLVSPEVIVNQREQDLAELTNEKNALERQKLVDLKREESRQAQLAGQFVLNIFQGYVLPLLYGLLGAATFVLRNLSKRIEDVVYSDEAKIQYTSRISLGALAGIMVGWFSFLLPQETTSFIGSVSPLAIAFLVGYNIEIFFSLMDIALNKVNETRERSKAATEKDDQKTGDQPDDSQSNAGAPPTPEKPTEEGLVVEGSTG